MYTDIANTFAANARDVERLIDFDRDVIDILLMSLDDLKKDVPPQVHSFAARIDRMAHVIRGIRNNESLKSKYGTVCNQAVVLLVSHFASVVGEFFRKGVSAAVDREGNDALLTEELKLTFRDMKDKNWNLKSAAGDLLIAKKDLTFQDMQSTVRAFDTYVGVQIPKDQCANNIILGQAARHVIVHAGAMVTERMLKQISGAMPRTLMMDLRLGAPLVFPKDDVLELRDEMLRFVESLASKLEAQQ